MNDNEAFEQWFLSLDDSYLNRVIKLNRGANYEAWQAACEYKKEVFDAYVRKDEIIKFIEAENKKLREALEFYANCTRLMLDVKDLPIDPIIGEPMFSSKSIMDNGDRAREALKEIGNN
jgi:hypothetical protein